MEKIIKNKKLIIPLVLILILIFSFFTGCMTNNKDKFIGNWRASIGDESDYIIFIFKDNNKLIKKLYHPGAIDPYIESSYEWKIIDEQKIKTIYESKEEIVKYNFKNDFTLILESKSEYYYLEKIDVYGNKINSEKGS